MSKDISLLSVGEIEAQIKRKRIQRLYMRVSLPGTIHISAPYFMSDWFIQRFIATHLPWIEKQKDRLKHYKPRVALKYITGECHEFLGQQYSLDVVHTDKRPSVFLHKKTITMHISSRSTFVERQKLMRDWCRKQLEPIVEDMLAQWGSIIGAESGKYLVRTMKSRWGTCNPRAGKITLALELARKPIECIEYVVVHELVHFLEKSHNARFKNFMTQYLPDWKKRKNVLNGK